MKASKGKSKRNGLPGLDPLWREKIFESIHSIRLKNAVAVLSCVGCRPSELERGVAMVVRNNSLVIVIRGSKVDIDKGRGQPERYINVARDTPWGIYLFALADQQEKKAIIVKYDAAGVSQRLREKSREIWPRRKSLVSAYSYRHYLGQSMKESGMDKEVIANVLGHASDYSQSVYGRRGSGKKAAGKHGVLEAKGSVPVRHSFRTDRIEVMKKQIAQKASRENIVK